MNISRIQLRLVAVAIIVSIILLYFGVVRDQEGSFARVDAIIDLVRYKELVRDPNFKFSAEHADNWVAAAENAEMMLFEYDAKLSNLTINICLLGFVVAIWLLVISFKIKGESSEEN